MLHRMTSLLQAQRRAVITTTTRRNALLQHSFSPSFYRSFTGPSTAVAGALQCPQFASVLNYTIRQQRRWYGEYEEEEEPMKKKNPFASDPMSQGNVVYHNEFGARGTQFDFNHRYKPMHPRICDQDGNHAFAANRYSFFVASVTHFTLLQMPYRVLEHASLNMSRRFCFDGWMLYNFDPQMGFGCLDVRAGLSHGTNNNSNQTTTRIAIDTNESPSQRSDCVNVSIAAPTDVSDNLTSFTCKHNQLFLFSRCSKLGQRQLTVLRGGEGESGSKAGATAAVTTPHAHDQEVVLASIKVVGLQDADEDIARVHVHDLSSPQPAATTTNAIAQEATTKQKQLIVGCSVDGRVLCVVLKTQTSDNKHHLEVVYTPASPSSSSTESPFFHEGELRCNAVLGGDIWAVLRSEEKVLQYINMLAWIEAWRNGLSVTHHASQTAFVVNQQWLGSKEFDNCRVQVARTDQKSWGVVSNATSDRGISTCYLHIFRTEINREQQQQQPHALGIDARAASASSSVSPDGGLSSVFTHPSSRDCHQVLSWSPNEGNVVALQPETNEQGEEQLLCVVRKGNEVKLFCFTLKAM